MKNSDDDIIIFLGLGIVAYLVYQLVNGNSANAAANVSTANVGPLPVLPVTMSPVSTPVFATPATAVANPATSAGTTSGNSVFGPNQSAAQAAEQAWLDTLLTGS
jgi:hypothetical protein